MVSRGIPHSTVRQVDSKYVKAYYRRSMANLRMEKKELAVLDLKKVMTYEPKNAQAREKLAILQGVAAG